MHALAGLCLLLYVLFLIICGRALLVQSAGLKFWAIALQALTFLLQLLMLVLVLFGEQASTDWADLFFKISAALVLADILIRLRYPYPIISFVLMTLSLVCFVSSSYLMHLTAKVNVASASYIYLLHVVPAATAILLQFLVLACSGAILFFDRALRKKHAGIIFLPNPGLARLSQWLRLTVSFSFLAWTLTVLSGAFYALLRQRGFLSGDFVNSFSLLTWLLATLLFYLVLTRTGKILTVARYSFLFSVFVAVAFVTKSLFLGTIVHSFLVF